MLTTALTLACTLATAPAPSGFEEAHFDVAEAPIPDQGAIRRRIEMPASRQTIDRVWAFVSINHTYRGDLRISLRSPDGTRTRLFNGKGGSQDDLVLSLQSERFRGENPGGDWTLIVRDRAAQDVGALVVWGLAFQYEGEPEPQACGSRGLPQCEDGEFCNYSRRANCGRADAPGQCAPLPEICPRHYMPVCGCDNMTYGNECEANAAGASVLHDGPCAEPPGGECNADDRNCGDGLYCHYEAGEGCGEAGTWGTCQIPPEACTREFDPVCGCDGQTYPNACVANGNGASVQHPGECEPPPPPPARRCGGFLGLRCPADQYCFYSDDMMCGGPLVLGTCQARPELCPDVWAPVCGCDQQTYGNGCEAAAAGMSIARREACEPPPPPPPPPPGEACGGFLGLRCAPDEYCHYTLDAMCGAADDMGECRQAPQACIEIYAPVCGCDGETYPNDCYANANGTSAAREGECGAPPPPPPPPPGQACGGLLGLACGPDQYCHYSLDAMCGAADQTGECRDAPQACIEIFAPVCGCDGETYENDCFANANGTSAASEGECGAPPPPPPPPPGRPCGGFAGIACPQDFFCDYGEACLIADAIGTCAEIPQLCIQVFDPVCGCDGQTYGNRCDAAAESISVLYDGPCAE